MTTIPVALAASIYNFLQYQVTRWNYDEDRNLKPCFIPNTINYDIEHPIQMLININSDYQKNHIMMISYLCMEITPQRGHFSFTKHAQLHTHWQKINSPISRTKHSHRHTQQRSLYFDSVQQISKRAKPTIHKTSKNQSLS